MSKTPQIFLKAPEDFMPTMHVASCYITCLGRLLLLKSAPHKPFGGSFSAPGGKMEPLETPLSTVIRETYEETGLMLDPAQIKHRATFYVRYPNLDFIYHVFVLRLSDLPAQIILSSREHVSYLWASAKEVASLPLMPAAYECFQSVYGKDLQGFLETNSEIN